MANITAHRPERLRELPFAYLELVKLHLIQRNYEGVRTLLQTLETFAEARNNISLRIRVYLLQSLLYAKRGEMETAVPRFRQTLNLAAPGKYVRLFLNHQDATLARLLHQAANNQVTAVAARALLSHLNPTLQTEEPITIQPLSSRELEVLHHLANGLTNREIAEQMVISLNTVKAHTRRLYEKLSVNNRTQAVTRAREARLLRQ